MIRPVREKKKRSHKTKFWCESCDHYLVGEWKKCPVCGHRNGSNRFKK